MTSGLLRACALSSLLLAASVAAVAQQALIVADDSTSAVAFGRQVGRVVTFICPSTLNRYREIWGTDVYDDESPICTAAVHAGVLVARTSGQVTIRMGTAAEALAGTERNGVTSLPSPSADHTYSFVSNSEPGQIDWHTSYDRVSDDFGSPITVTCPPNGNQDSTVIGTDVYRADSAICVAAVHVGIITLATGGGVTVTLQPKREELVASVRNNVSSQPWRDWNYRSYPQPYSVTPGAVSASRTIRLAGFAGSGIGADIVPRTIRLTGFAGSGTGVEIVPRTIRIRGWSGAGTAP